MSSQPADVLGLATRLVSPIDGNPLEEVALRCSTSRAYYAALHAADGALPPDLALTAADKRGKSSHQAVIDATLLWARAVRPGRTEAISVARNLARLRDARKKADYKLDQDFTLEYAIEALKIAEATVASATKAARLALDKQA